MVAVAPMIVAAFAVAAQAAAAAVVVAPLAPGPAVVGTAAAIAVLLSKDSGGLRVGLEGLLGAARRPAYLLSFSASGVLAGGGRDGHQ